MVEHNLVFSTKNDSTASMISLDSYILEFIIEAEENCFPKKAHKTDAAYDLFSNEDITLPARSTRPYKVKTGIKMKIPNGYKANILPRSGLSSKGVIITNSPGTIDSGYRDEVMVLLMNLSNDDYYIRKGDRIAQMDFQFVLGLELKEGKVIKDESDRKGGFGSTGV